MGIIMALNLVTICVSFEGLLNLRGLDIPYNPVFFAYVILTASEVHLYVEQPSRITEEIEKHFQEEGVEDEIKVFDYNLIKTGLKNIVSVNITIPMNVLFVMCQSEF